MEERKGKGKRGEEARGVGGGSEESWRTGLEKREEERKAEESLHQSTRERERETERQRERERERGSQGG